MLDEAAMRREDRLPGFRIDLPGRGGWTVPGPEYIGGDDDGRDGWFRANYGRALLDLAEAADEGEYRRAELALVICLLARNYRLTPDDYGRLFSGCAGPDRLRASIRGAVERHAAGLIAAPAPASARPQRRWVDHVAGRVWALINYLPSRPATLGA